MASFVSVFLGFGVWVGVGGVSVVVSWFLASARQKDVAGVGGRSWVCVFWRVVTVWLFIVGGGGWWGCVFGAVGLLFVPRFVRCGFLGEFTDRMFGGGVGVLVRSGF